MIELQITGLNSRQKLLADIMWSIEDWDQVETFINSLPKKDKIDCEGIIQMMRMSLVEQHASAIGIQEFPEATALINKVKK